MKYLDLTFENPAHNLACDEILLDRCEADESGPLLRVWKPQRPFIVLGYSRPLEEDVYAPSAEAAGVPILRRCSGGGTVLQGPGCLNFSLFLRIGQEGPLGTLSGTHRFVLARHQKALEPILREPITIEGTSDLAIGGVKFSGSAQRRKRRFALLHGTFLLSLDLALMERLLPVPDLQPAYRRRRSHTSFLRNLRVEPQLITSALRSAWDAHEPLESSLPLAEISRLIAKHPSRSLQMPSELTSSAGTSSLPSATAPGT